MKDWRKLFVDTSPTIFYDSYAVLETLKPGRVESEDYDGPSGDDYEAIRRELQAQVRSGLVSADTDPPEDTVMGGGSGLEPIWVLLGVAATAVGAYSGIKEIAADFRRLVERIRPDDHDERVNVGETGAIICAWAYVSPEGGEDVAFEYVAPVQKVTTDSSLALTGWLVGFTVDGEAVCVLVALDGEVMGKVPGPVASAFAGDRASE